MDNEQKKADVTFKIVIVGESDVGKSCILLQYSKGTFTSHHIATIGVDYFNKFLEIDNKVIKMQIWDTAGQERFRSISNQYLKNSHGIILVYDITDRNSFEKVEGWIENIREHTNVENNIILVGNKSDLDAKRVVTDNEGIRLSRKYEIDFFEVSARNNTNINPMFEALIKKILSADGINCLTDKIELNNNENDEKKKCTC